MHCWPWWDIRCGSAQDLQRRQQRERDFQGQMLCTERDSHALATAARHAQLQPWHRSKAAFLPLSHCMVQSVLALGISLQIHKKVVHSMVPFLWDWKHSSQYKHYLCCFEEPRKQPLVTALLSTEPPTKLLFRLQLLLTKQCHDC